MKPLLTAFDFGSPLHGDRVWKKCIDTPYPGKIFSAYRCIEMNHLRERVHTGIGAARASRGYGCLTKLCECGFEDILHGPAMRLRLPAMPWATVVLHSECDAFQHVIP
jgi:hypothetical protein